VEFERRKKIEEEKQNKLAAEEKKRLRELHDMRCPKWYEGSSSPWPA